MDWLMPHLVMMTSTDGGEDGKKYRIQFWSKFRSYNFSLQNKNTRRLLFGYDEMNKSFVVVAGTIEPWQETIARKKMRRHRAHRVQD